MPGQTTHRSWLVPLLGVPSPELPVGVAPPDVDRAVGGKGKHVVVTMSDLDYVYPLEGVYCLRLEGGPKLVEVVAELAVVVGTPGHDTSVLLLGE